MHLSKYSAATWWHQFISSSASCFGFGDLCGRFSLFFGCFFFQRNKNSENFRTSPSPWDWIISFLFYLFFLIVKRTIRGGKNEHGSLFWQPVDSWYYIEDWITLMMLLKHPTVEEKYAFFLMFSSQTP